MFDVTPLLYETRTFPPEMVERLRLIFREVRYRKHDFFIRQGETPRSVALIRKGYFRSYVYDERANEVTQYFFFEGSVLYPYEAAHKKTANAYDLVAEEDSTVLAAEIEEFEAVMGENERLRQLYREIVTDVISVKNAHALSFKICTNEERYRQLLERYPQIEQRARQYHIASFLGMTPVTLSRLRSKKIINR